MIVTGIEMVTKIRSKIYIDEQLAFILYKGELSRYHIEVGEEISEETYREIIDEVLTKRAKARALHILQTMERTEHQLRDKLRQNGYPSEVIDKAAEYVKSYHYVDDDRYAKGYVASRSMTKSKRQIQQDLQNKGIAREKIQNIYEDLEVDETDLIRKLVVKKHLNLETATREEMHKVYMSLIRKGFRSEDIRKVLYKLEEY